MLSRHAGVGKRIEAGPLCSSCATPVVAGARFCHACGRPLAGRAPSQAGLLVAALVVGLAVGLAFASFVPAAVPVEAAAAADGSALLLAPSDLAAGLVLPPLPDAFRDALGVAANPDRLPPDVVDSFTETFGVRPSDARVAYVAPAEATERGVLAFSFAWEASSEAAAARDAFVTGAGCHDVDRALAGARRVIVLVAVGADYRDLDAAADLVVDGLEAKDGSLREICVGSASAAPGSALVLRAVPSDLGRGAALAELVHEGGPLLNWSAVDVRVLRDGIPTVAVAFGRGGCDGATFAPEGAFAPGDRLVLCATDGAWADATRLDLRLERQEDGGLLFAEGVDLAQGP